MTMAMYTYNRNTYLFVYIILKVFKKVKCKWEEDMLPRKILTVMMIVAIMLTISPQNVEPGVCHTISYSADATFQSLSLLLNGTNAGDLSFCIGHIKNSKYTNQDIANFILTWSPEIYKKQIPVVFRSKLDRVLKRLRSVDYEQLLMDIDLIKNSQLSVKEMVRVITTAAFRRKN